jgi:hypothetical protein
MRHIHHLDDFAFLCFASREEQGVGGDGDGTRTPQGRDSMMTTHRSLLPPRGSWAVLGLACFGVPFGHLPPLPPSLGNSPVLLVARALGAECAGVPSAGRVNSHVSASPTHGSGVE